ncbi:membrane protein [Pseudomonas syringae CC1557]|uniref:Membrane protein n=1 Tax=Pseudomonas syringae CC1557 TaxID=1357279 RepID=W0MVG1_PSESX|nr:membrane protein [Pseudomonas syringae CC1557]
MSYKQLFRLALCGVALLGSTLASADDTQADFASQTPLKLSGNGPWYRIELPMNVQLNSRQQDLGDLRIFNAQGQAQAYALDQNPPQAKQSQAPTMVKWFPLYNRADELDRAPRIKVERSATGTLVEVQPQDDAAPGEQVLRGWLLDTSTIRQPLQKLILDWDSAQDGFQRFSIEASDDLQNWSPWGASQVARLSFDDQTVEQREVTLPGRTARYLRLIWRSSAEAPMLTSVQLVTVNTDTPPLPLAWSEPVIGSVEKAGSYIWQLPTGLPVERLQVDMAQANSVAPGRFYGRTDSKAPWQSIGNGLLYRLAQDGKEVIQNEVETNGTIVRQVKLELDERGGGLGSSSPALRFALRAPQVVFLARGDGPFTLATGNSAAKPANLPLATLIPDYSAQKMNSLGRAEPENMQVKLIPMSPDDASGIDWKRIGLWSVLVLGVILLGWMAFSTLRASPSKARAGSNGDESPLLFTRTPSGEWEALEGYYQVRFEGARVGSNVNLNVDGKPEASVFIWSELSHDDGVRGRIWTLGAKPEFGELRVGHHTCNTIFLALAKAVSETDNVTLVYDTDIRKTVDERWGP